MQNINRAIHIYFFDRQLPFASFFVPDCCCDFMVEVHEFSEIESSTDTIEVLPDMVRLGEHFGPMRLQFLVQS
jgi:hypothetical protein